MLLVCNSILRTIEPALLSALLPLDNMKSLLNYSLSLLTHLKRLTRTATRLVDGRNSTRPLNSLTLEQFSSSFRSTNPLQKLTLNVSVIRHWKSPSVNTRFPSRPTRGATLLKMINKPLPRLSILNTLLMFGACTTSVTPDRHKLQADPWLAILVSLVKSSSTTLTTSFPLRLKLTLANHTAVNHSSVRFRLLSFGSTTNCSSARTYLKSWRRRDLKRTPARLSSKSVDSNPNSTRFARACLKSNWLRLSLSIFPWITHLNSTSKRTTMAWTLSSLQPWAAWIKLCSNNLSSNGKHLKLFSTKARSSSRTTTTRISRSKTLSLNTLAMFKRKLLTSERERPKKRSEREKTFDGFK